MYYDRSLEGNFANVLKEKLNWLVEFVKNNEDLDILIGKDDKKNQWISIYRGLSRIIKITPYKNKNNIKVDGANSYKELNPSLYGKKDDFNFKKELQNLLEKVRNNEKFKRYYDSKKEGYYQIKISRQYGIDSNRNSDFVIVDKEVVIGYENEAEKNKIFNPIQLKYKEILKFISKTDAKSYGKDLEKKALGNELDILALNKNGDILLMELKHGSNTHGIYLSPIQIGVYYELFKKLHSQELENIIKLIKQKQEYGLISKEWEIPKLSGKIIPILVIAEYSPNSSQKEKFEKILQITREKLNDKNFLSDLKVFNFNEYGNLEKLKFKI